jgi:hypothetical protein
MEGHDEFERVLQSRYVPLMRSNLPERIIAASLKVEKRKESFLVAWLKDFFEGFAMPKPAYAMVVALVIGFGIGATPQDGSSSDTGFMQAQIQADIGDML